MLRAFKHLKRALVRTVFLLGKQTACPVGAQKLLDVRFKLAHGLGGIARFALGQRIAQSHKTGVRKLNSALFQNRFAQCVRKCIGNQPTSDTRSSNGASCARCTTSASAVPARTRSIW